MITDTELKLKGMQTLVESLGDIEAERFVALIQREPFDYTKWRAGKWEEMTVDDISRNAMKLREKRRDEIGGDHR